MAVPLTWNSSQPIVTQFNKINTDGTVLRVDDGDTNVILIPGDGEPSATEFGIITVNDAAVNNGSAFQKQATTRFSGADGTWAAAGMRRAAFYSEVTGLFDKALTAAGAQVGFAAPLAGSTDCYPCPGPSDSTKFMMTQWACAYGYSPDDLLYDGADRLWEVTMSGPLTWTVGGRIRNGSQIANNNPSFSFTAAETSTRAGGPGGVFSASTLQADASTHMTNAWIKFLTTVAPPSLECGSATRGWDSVYVTAAGVTAGDMPEPAGEPQV